MADETGIFEPVCYDGCLLSAVYQEFKPVQLQYYESGLQNLPCRQVSFQLLLDGRLFLYPTFPLCQIGSFFKKPDFMQKVHVS